MKKRIFSALTAALFVLVTIVCALPALAKVEASYSTPSG